MLLNKKRILFYSDAPFCGGHERMSTLIANTLIDQGLSHVQFCYACSEIADMLDDRAIKYELPFATKLPLPFLRNISFKDIRVIKELLDSSKPDIFIVAQGDIEYGLKGLLGARLANLPVISYLPMAYTFKEMKAKMSLLRDKLDSLYYRIPSQFITINKYQAKLLRRFTSRRIHIIRNHIIDDNLYEEKKCGTTTIFQRYRACDNINIGMIGRVTFRQKNQKAVIAVAKACRQKGIKAKWHIIGDGPDLPLLCKIVEEEGLNEEVIFHGWMEKEHVRRMLREVIDIVFIPSFFEGLPLVLLETIAAETPFLISNLEWVNDFDIPEEFIVNFSEVEDVCQRLLKLSQYNCLNIINELKKHFQDIFSFEKFLYDVNTVFRNIL